MSDYVLLEGDCLEQLKELPDDSVDSMVTDPPAGISFMGKAWDEDKGGRKQWIAWMSSVMLECKRVLKPGAHALVWAIPRTSHWTATALEEAGFEIRDVVTHLFGSGFPKSLDISKAIDKAAGAVGEIIGVNPNHRKNADGEIHETGTMVGEPHSGDGLLRGPGTPEAKRYQGWGTALKPASEHWILCRKPISEKTVAANTLKHGTGGINIDASRIDGQASVPFGRQTGPGISANGNGGTHGKMERTEFVPNTLGRFPANLVLSHNVDCETECTHGCAIAMLDEQSGVSKSQVRKLNGEEIKVPKEAYGDYGKRTEGGFVDTGGASRFFYCAKASKSEKNAGCEGLAKKAMNTYNFSEDGSMQANATAKNGLQERLPRANHHPTVKSTKLMSYLIKLITPTNGVILDPFLGSGTTGVSALIEGFSFIGIEKEPEYFKIAEARLNNVKTKGKKAAA